jgi:hypothetical protein
MSEPVDMATRVLNRTLDVIFTKYPARTSLGVVLGCVFLFIIRLLNPALQTITMLDFSGAPWWGWLFLGILAMHTPTIVYLFGQKPVGDDAIDKALDLIDRGNFSHAERRQQFRNLIERVSKQVALNEQAKSKVRAIEQSITSTESDAGKE